MALAYTHLAPSLALLIHTQGGMFAYATSFNGDLSSWNASRGEDFVSVCGLHMMLVQPSHVQEDPLLWPWHMLTWLPLLLSSLQNRMFYSATSFNQDLSMWDVSSGQEFVSACELGMILAQPSHVQKDPHLWPCHTLTWLPLLLSSSTHRKACLLKHHPSMEMFPHGMSRVDETL